MKIAAQVVGAVGGAVLTAAGVSAVVAGASTRGVAAGLGIIAILIGLCVILVALIATRRNPVGSGVLLIIFGTIGLLLSWPAAAVIFLGALLSVLAPVRFGRGSSFRPVAMILGALGGATELVFGLMGAGALLAGLRSGYGSSLPDAGAGLLKATLSVPALLFIAGLVALLSAVTLTPKRPVIAGILLLAAGAVGVFFWSAAPLVLRAATALVLGGAVLAFAGASEANRRAAAQPQA